MHTKPIRHKEFLYETDIAPINYTLAEEYFEEYKPNLGACSVVVKDNLVGRNYDWDYDNKVTFVVNTNHTWSRLATTCTCAAPSGLTKEMIEAGEDSPLYDILPFICLDGMNECGVFCEINVVSVDEYGSTTGTNPGKPDLFALMIPRYVLDHAKNVDHAIKLLQNRNIYCIDKDDYKEEFHFLIKDKDRAVVIEFIGNEMKVIDTFVEDKPIMTNFYLYGYDGTWESLTPYAMGIERQALLTNNYSSVETAEDMYELMQLVRYTKMYDRDTEPFWYSEYCGNWGETYGNLTKYSTPEEYKPLVDHVIDDFFAHRERGDGHTWETVTSCVYDLENMRLIIDSKESGELVEFKFKDKWRYLTMSMRATRNYGQVGGKEWYIGGRLVFGENAEVKGLPGELPKVTPSDEGKVLGVNQEGKWDKVEASGGLKLYRHRIVIKLSPTHREYVFDFPSTNSAQMTAENVYVSPFPFVWNETNNLEAGVSNRFAVITRAEHDNYVSFSGLYVDSDGTVSGDGYYHDISEENETLESFTDTVTEA